MKLTALAVLIGSAPWLAGCVQTNEMALAPNVVRLDTQASGLLSMGQAGPATQRRAAELTLQSGYSHYRLADASTSQTQALAGVVTSTNGNVSAPFAGSAQYSEVNIATPVYRRTQNVGVTVVMFHADEPGAKGAFDARQVLQQIQARAAV